MAAMLSLLDALPRHERVDIGSDQFLMVYGLSGESIGKILGRFPDAFMQIANSGSQPQSMEPGLLGALIAGSQRGEDGEAMLGNDKAEINARAFAVADQAKLLQAMGRCTFPDGVGPFLDLLESMSSRTAEAAELIVKVVSKGQDTKSPPTPKPLEPPDIQVSGS